LTAPSDQLNRFPQKKLLRLVLLSDGKTTGLTPLPPK